MSFIDRQYFLDLLSKDAPNGDITSELVVEPGAHARAHIIAKTNGIISGVEEAYEIFTAAGLVAKPAKFDGSEIGKGEIVMEIQGDARKLLLCERLALNFLMRMSGIATITRQFIDICREANPDIRIAATRKTTPGFSEFEKKAVIHGGGDPHRFNLSGGIMVKDNHFVVAGGVKEALLGLAGAGMMQKIDVEVDNESFLEEVLSYKPDIVMLDNFSPERVERAARFVREQSPGTLVEVSGGVTFDTAKEYAAYADIISTSALTMTPARMDLSLDIVEVRRD